MRPRTSHLGVTDGFRTRDPQYHKLMLYQLSYGHHEGLQCATCCAEFHHDIHRSVVWTELSVTRCSPFGEHLFTTDSVVS